MKIAVTYENGRVFQHFGHTEQFKIYQVEDGKVTASQVVETAGSGHGALAGFLRDQGVDTLICGGIGGGAKTALAQAGIQLYGGVSGNTAQAVEDLLAASWFFSRISFAAIMGKTIIMRDTPAENTAVGKAIAITKRRTIKKRGAWWLPSFCKRIYSSKRSRGVISPVQVMVSWCMARVHAT